VRTRLLLPALGAALACAASPATASAYKQGTYTGTTDQGRAIVLGADGSRVRGLDTKVISFCQLPKGTRHEPHRLRPARGQRIAIKDSKFSKTVSLYDGGTAKVSGKLGKKGAKGSVAVTYTAGSAACTGKTKWTATWSKKGYPPRPPASPKVAKPGATFTGTTGDGDGLSFKISDDGSRVRNIVARFRYTCDDATGSYIDLSSNGEGADIDQSTAHFAYAADLKPSGPPTNSAHFDLSGDFSNQGRSATGTLHVSFTRTDDQAACDGQASWSASSG
jgi:hypothetical protein